MANVRRPGSQQPDAKNTSTNEKLQQTQDAAAPTTPATPSASTQPKGKQSSNRRKSTIGGAAVQGAKSMQPKELPTGAMANQKPEYYNRETRRRMQHMGTGPYQDRAQLDLRAQRQKRLEKRQAKVRELVNEKGPSRDIRLGKRNTYFVIALVIALIVAITIAVILRFK